MKRHIVRVAVGLAFAMSVDGAEPCGPVNEAMLKLAQTPHHAFIESSGAIAGGKANHSERIATASASFVLVAGKWHKSVMTPQRALQEQKESLKEKKNLSCRYLREEVVQGEKAALFATHDESDGGNADSQIWISRARGLPLKTVLHLSVADGTIGASQVTTRYDYENARAPEGVQ